MIRLALGLTRPALDGGIEPRSFAVRMPRPGLWVALSTAAIAAEALALKPVLFPDEGTFEWLNLVVRIVGG